MKHLIWGWQSYPSYPVPLLTPKESLIEPTSQSREVMSKGPGSKLWWPDNQCVLGKVTDMLWPQLVLLSKMLTGLWRAPSPQTDRCNRLLQHWIQFISEAWLNTPAVSCAYMALCQTPNSAVSSTWSTSLTLCCIAGQMDFRWPVAQQAWAGTCSVL